MVPGGWQVLYEAAPQMHIQELHPTANPKQRQVASQRFIDEGGFDGIPLRIGQFGLRGGNFAVERRVHVATAGQLESATRADSEAGPGFLQHRLRADGFNRARIRLDLRTFPIYDEDSFAHGRGPTNCTRRAIVSVQLGRCGTKTLSEIRAKLSGT